MDQCSHCGYFIWKWHGDHGTGSRCVKHGPLDVIASKGWCKYFRRGMPGEFGSKPLSQTTKKESGYVEDARASMKGGHDWREREG